MRGDGQVLQKLQFRQSSFFKYVNRVARSTTVEHAEHCPGFTDRPHDLRKELPHNLPEPKKAPDNARDESAAQSEEVAESGRRPSGAAT